MSTFAYPEYPRQLKIELVRGCNRKCAFCSLGNEPDSDNLRLMDTDRLVSKILTPSKEKGVAQVSYSIHGEPTLHPDIVYIVRYTKDLFPNARILIHTNGANMGLIPTLFKAGATHIHLDLYDKEALREFEESGIKAPEGETAYAEDDNIYTSSAKRLLSVARPLIADLVQRTDIRQFDTQGGSAKYEIWERFNVDKRAFPLFRSCKELNKYMVVDWDGNVKPCCADGSRSIYVGNVFESSIQEVWQSRFADMVRYALHRGHRDLIPSCYACNRRSFRDALWPHWGNKYLMEDIGKEVAKRTQFPAPFWGNMEKLNKEHEITKEPMKTLLNNYLCHK